MFVRDEMRVGMRRRKREEQKYKRKNNIASLKLLKCKICKILLYKDSQYFRGQLYLLFQNCNNIYILKDQKLEIAFCGELHINYQILHFYLSEKSLICLVDQQQQFSLFYFEISQDLQHIKQQSIKLESRQLLYYPFFKFVLKNQLSTKNADKKIVLIRKNIKVEIIQQSKGQELQNYNEKSSKLSINYQSKEKLQFSESIDLLNDNQTIFDIFPDQQQDNFILVGFSKLKIQIVLLQINQQNLTFTKNLEFDLKNIIDTFCVNNQLIIVGDYFLYSINIDTLKQLDGLNIQFDIQQDSYKKLIAVNQQKIHFIQSILKFLTDFISLQISEARNDIIMIQSLKQKLQENNQIFEQLKAKYKNVLIEQIITNQTLEQQQQKIEQLQEENIKLQQSIQQSTQYDQFQLKLQEDYQNLQISYEQLKKQVDIQVQLIKENQIIIQEKEQIQNENIQLKNQILQYQKQLGDKTTINDKEAEKMLFDSHLLKDENNQLIKQNQELQATIYQLQQEQQTQQQELEDKKQYIQQLQQQNIQQIDLIKHLTEEQALFQSIIRNEANQQVYEKLNEELLAENTILKQNILK